MPTPCAFCFKSFASKSSLYRHWRNVHNKFEEKSIVSYDFNCYNSKCLEDNCLKSFRRTSDLREHLKCHGISIEMEILRFDTFNEFESWLRDIQKSGNIEYVRHSYKVLSTIYYNCNRSGKYLGCTTDRKRALKSQGSCKIGSQCTSQIILTSFGDGKCVASFYKTHYGHGGELEHIRLPKESRVEVAAKLTSGVSVTRVLDTFRSKFEEDKLSRADLITRKDLQNIKSSFHINIYDGVRHENDSTSVDLLIRQCHELGTEEVLLYKKQGEEYPRLTSEDFCLIIMNKAQQNMLVTFGNNIIAIDSTHGLNMYDFELTTMMVIDEYGEGFPTACMFTNRKDTLINEIFFEKVKERTGIIFAKVFMSDITVTFYNAWRSVMAPVDYQLYCSWHVDRAWKKNLNKIMGSDDRTQVYQTLKVLQSTMEVHDFEKKMSAAINIMLGNPNTRLFGIYFRDNYVENCRLWAYCYRRNCGINTNMVLESMHKTVKYFYLEGKTVKRLDKGLTALLKYIRDKIVSRIIKATKGVNNSHIQDIHKRHRVAISSNFLVTQDANCSWTLTSNGTEYMISKCDKDCKCQLKCSFCNICIHEYVCSCPDFLLRASICKHIHFVVLNTSDNERPADICNKSKYISTDECLSTLVKTSYGKENRNNQIKNKITDEINNISLNIERCDDFNILPHVLKTVTNANTLLCTSLNKEVLNKSFKSETTDSVIPSNKKLKKQDLFYSTKKKYCKKNQGTKKPSIEETDIINKTLTISSDSTHDHSYCKIQILNNI